MGREDPYELKRGWSYELVEYSVSAPKETYRVIPNTRCDGLREDIEVGTGWTAGQIQTACREVWYEELMRKQCLQEMPFEVREAWTCELKDQNEVPQWVIAQEYGVPLKSLRPGELVMVGMQLEDGPRLERNVKRDTTEYGLKLKTWQGFCIPADCCTCTLRASATNRC
jgi:hypothetical protein